MTIELLVIEKLRRSNNRFTVIFWSFTITDWFKQYQVETIELWISGMMETGGVTKLVVSAKGEGGLKVVLKPKTHT
jgi:hypothetical protein